MASLSTLVSSTSAPVTSVLGRYLAKHYVLNFLALLSALLLIIYLFDLVELIRRAEKRDDVPLTLVLQMGFLKLPEVGQLLLPFAILFSAMFTFWQLTKRSELIIARASGFSVWQFLTPLCLVALGIGILQMTTINPLSALLISQFETLESKHLTRQDNHIALFEEGLWLRQSQIPSDDREGFNEEAGYFIIHASDIDPKTWTLSSILVLSFDQNNSFKRRIDAQNAELQNGRWVFNDVQIHSPGQRPLNQSQFVLPTNLTRTDIEDSFSSTATMSFWALPTHIQTLKQTGFNSARLQVHYQNLISQPFLFVAMVLLAAAVTLHRSRIGHSFMMIAFAVFMGFCIFFASSFLQALGASGQIPVLLSAWGTPIICLLIGTGLMLSLEDG